jgi:hypothetical protein
MTIERFASPGGQWYQDPGANCSMYSEGSQIKRINMSTANNNEWWVTHEEVSRKCEYRRYVFQLPGGEKVKVICYIAIKTKKIGQIGRMLITVDNVPRDIKYTHFFHDDEDFVQFQISEILTDFESTRHGPTFGRGLDGLSDRENELIEAFLLQILKAYPPRTE